MHFIKQKLRCFLLILFCKCCFIQSICAQSAEDKIIPGDQLKWDYYTIKYNTNSTFWATTLWNVYYKYKVVSIRFNTVKVDLQTWHVLKADSWVLKNKESDELLHHEQGHFNTAILCEAEFKKAVDTTTLFITNYGDKIDSIFNAVLKNTRDLNVAYDKETNHMWNKAAQKIWDKKIDEMINNATK